MIKAQDLMYIYIKTKYNDNIEIEIKKGALNQFKYFECAVQLFKDSQNYFLDEEQGLISFDSKECVVYGIYSKGKLIYIGSTVDKNNRKRFKLSIF